MIFDFHSRKVCEYIISKSPYYFRMFGIGYISDVLKYMNSNLERNFVEEFIIICNGIGERKVNEVELGLDIFYPLKFVLERTQLQAHRYGVV